MTSELKKLERQAVNGKYEFMYPHRLPSLNEYIRANRANAYAGADMKKRTETGIIYTAPNIPIEHYPVVVHFTWYEPNKRRDIDNVAFAKKFILDALVKKGVLAGDNPNYVTGFTDKIVYEKGTEGVFVQIERQV